ncbi:hypothetical protein [Pseudomonas sp. Irchel 3E20]|uniref:hypothetical protein n=1 Tax=Pseudomonas sp. Irchel 3E20 TaxID=2008983 RepID=UPI000BA46695|nr:hypothetical protein [Pseudomonas sp. Irchel 3E20]
MKRSALAGLFITAAMLASPVFAAEDLCAINLQKISDAKVSTGEMPEDLKNTIDKAESEAKAAQAAGNKDECISLTTQAIQEIANNNKGGK